MYARVNRGKEMRKIKAEISKTKNRKIPEKKTTTEKEIKPETGPLKRLMKQLNLQSE